MTGKRQRKNNWSHQENKVLEYGLYYFGRNDITKIHYYLYDNVPNFCRSYKDVKKKIYNYLYEDIFHEISVKVRINLCYSILILYNADGNVLDATDQFINKLSKFCGHSIARMYNNYKLLVGDQTMLRMGLSVVDSVMKYEGVSAVYDLITDGYKYIKLLQQFREDMN